MGITIVKYASYFVNIVAWQTYLPSVLQLEGGNGVRKSYLQPQFMLGYYLNIAAEVIL